MFHPGHLLRNEQSVLVAISRVLIYLLLLVESNEKLISATAGSLSTGTASAFSGQHNVGHKGVATRCGVLSLYSFTAQSECFRPTGCWSRRRCHTMGRS